MASLTAAQVSDRLAAAKSPAEVDAVFAQMIAEGELPDWLVQTDGWPTITITGNGHTWRGKVSPTYAAVGVDNYPIGRQTPFLVQEIASRLKSIVPSRKLVLEAQRQSTTKIPYIDIKDPKNPADPIIETQAGLDKLADRIRKAFSDRGIVPGDGIVYGYRKSIVSAPKLDGSHVAIAGGDWGDGTAVQPFSTIHSAHDYGDSADSAGPFYLRQGELDGRPADIVDDGFMSDDPTVVALFNDYHSTKTGGLERYNPEFPNANKDSATFSMMSGDDGDEDFSSFGPAPVGGKSVKPTFGATTTPAPRPSLFRVAVGAMVGVAATVAAGFAAPGIALGAAYGAGASALSGYGRH